MRKAAPEEGSFRIGIKPEGAVKIRYRCEFPCGPTAPGKGSA